MMSQYLTPDGIRLPVVTLSRQWRRPSYVQRVTPNPTVLRLPLQCILPRYTIWGLPMAILADIALSIKHGTLDSVAVQRSLVLAVRSHKIRMRLLQCLILNGIFIVGSIAFFNLLISPIVSYIVRSVLTRDLHDLEKLVANWVEWIYYAFWIVPIYLVSFILNTFWYRDIARESMSVYPGASAQAISPGLSLPGQIADMIVRVIFNFVFLVYLGVLSQWKVLYILNLSFLISFNAFEYKLGHLTFHQKLRFIERHWVYFLSFSIWVSILVAQFRAMIENGLLAVFFPILLMSASTSGRPIALNSDANHHVIVKWILSWIENFPVFFIVEKLTDFAVWSIDFFNARRN
jgi:hypothetical protein